MRSVASHFAPGQRRGYAAKDRVVAAFEDVLGRDHHENVEVVLSALADFCGYYGVTPPQATSDELRFQEGKRAVFAYVLSHLRMSPEKRRALEMAARHEAEVNSDEGEL